MSSFKTWLEYQIETNHIKYFNYAEFSDIICVGEGGSGTVCKANWDGHGMSVALKILKISSLVDEFVWEEFVRELTILRKCSANDLVKSNQFGFDLKFDLIRFDNFDLQIKSKLQNKI
ncbi:hypothetical protein RclHR1_09870010 [Rhizophagus clarus]|uniref:Kinase-like domain-containing protein n=1 Tax=Rhizophagus clarus TaxID=94130 RepID=A0A2Z6S7U1_9GLOM|nr:hypothetical protein RclHR1_09870010 [Rhizophagus clarus]GES92443.1 kinase-like domain-containing protein [Rhizophagus clarus]